MSEKKLIIHGARQNNLKNINLELPHNKVIAVTGVSGSGKSSLAFDTIFAEGQWRFIESLSTYARLFLEKLDRPDVDAIHNIRPAIALEQKNPVRGSRSTVGTLTELYEFFRLLYAKISVPHCPRCGKEIRQWDPSQIVSELTEKYAGSKTLIVFETDMTPEELRKRGYRRIWAGNEIVEIDDPSAILDPPFLVVLDRLILREEPRLNDSVEMAWNEGNGKLQAIILQPAESLPSSSGGSPFMVLRFSGMNNCEDCNITVPEPTAILFSFNHPVGACPECKGFGNALTYDEDLLIPDKDLSLSEGALDPWNKPAYVWWRKQLLKKSKKSGLDVNKPFSQFSEQERTLLFKGTEDFYGINDFFEDLEGRRYKLHVRVFLSRYRKAVTCPECNGKRLKKDALAYKLDGRDIGDLSRMSVSDLLKHFARIELSPHQKDISQELLAQITMKLQFLEKVGLTYLTLDRYGKTLSGGEFQRINLSNQLASLLTGTLYVLDEPTVGLHPRDTERIAHIMKQLSELGNTVIVVEHDRSIIESADWVVELGPGGGHRGGEVVFSGTMPAFLKSDTLTSRFITGKEKVETHYRRKVFSGGSLCLYHASGNNLKGVDFSLPIRRLTVVTGVSGSGKSSLVSETLYRALCRKFKTDTETPLPFDSLEGAENFRGIKLIDQSPIGRSPRSNPVTYLKIFDHIRKVFADQREAKAHGYGPGFFSFNVPGGRCEVCKGEGYELMEMYFFENLFIKCEKCGGKRYKPDTLRIHYKGRSIHDILHLTVEEALTVFEDTPAIRSKLALMMETGLGYLQLGQSATTLSGGEAQRLKICSEMGSAGKGEYLYILDEPTVGLHFSDVNLLLGIINRLVDAGNTVLVIEHNLDVIKAADWIVDLGPEGGDKGGSILFEGTPDDIVNCRQSYTGQYLRSS